MLDYLSKWIQEKKKEIRISKPSAGATSRTASDGDSNFAFTQVSRAESVLAEIPAKVISQRAVECKSYSRALFYWEQYIRQQISMSKGELSSREMEPLYEKLQDIYTQIDEPDGIEGISAHLQVLNIDQQILEHRKAGRWTAAQSWYEILLSENPQDPDVQYNLLMCLKESGQYGTLAPSCY